MLINRGWGEDGTEFSPFSSVSGAAEAERCQAGHVTLPALRTCRNSQVQSQNIKPWSLD
jgi:hypothetical protein